MSGKRSRSSNFTKEEELLLIQEVAKFKNVIECKTTNKITKKEKEEAWNKIFHLFNARCEVQPRTLEQMQIKYDNLKTKARKEVADTNKYIKGTGGGPAYVGLNPVAEAILNVINYKTVVGLESSFDSDSMATASQVDIAQPSCSYLSLATVATNEPVAAVATYAPVAAVATYDLPSPITIEYLEVSPSSNEEVGSVKKYSTEDTIVDWSVYTPAKLKKKTSRKLQPTISNPVFAIKQQFYKHKMEYLNRAEEREIHYAKLNQERLEEEHTNKMKVLELEIKLKEKQLNNKN